MPWAFLIAGLVLTWHCWVFDISVAFDWAPWVFGRTLHMRQVDVREQVSRSSL